MADYKVGIIGCTGRGDYGHGLDAFWKSLDNCHVAAVADPDEAGRIAAQVRTGAAKAYADYRELLDRERPDIVAVCPRWADQHHDMLLACAGYGCHMYVEKPLCRDLREADEIIRACEMRHLKLAVAHLSRYSPQLVHVRQLIESGEIGEVLEIRARGKEDARGGGEDLWVLGSHALDLMRAIAGDPEWCFATLSQGGRRVSQDDVREGNEGLGPLAGDRVDAMFRFGRGVTGYFASQRSAGGSPSRFGLRILGSRGQIELTCGYATPASIMLDPTWSGAAGRGVWRTISSNGVDQPETLTATGYDGGNPAAALDLFAAIEQDRQPLCSVYDARGAVELIMAVFESHRSAAPVPLPMASVTNPLRQLTL